MEPATPRPWYKKKRYIVPLGLVGAMFVGSAMGDTSTPPPTYTPPVQQVAPAAAQQATPSQLAPAAEIKVKSTNTSTVAPSSSSGSGYYTNVDGNKVQSPTYYPSAPAGASARCRDGTYSFSQHRSGTCSHHGGVATWL